MRSVLTFLLFVATVGATDSSPASEIRPVGHKTSIGERYLSLGRVDEAKKICDEALSAEPTNKSAEQCLLNAEWAIIKRDLINAKAALSLGDKKAAIFLASKHIPNKISAEQDKSARGMIRAATATSLYSYIFNSIPEWLRQLLVTVLCIAIAFLLIALRKLRREWRRAKWYGRIVTTTRGA